jgi:hypothetical protein
MPPKAKKFGYSTYNQRSAMLISIGQKWRLVVASTLLFLCLYAGLVILLLWTSINLPKTVAHAEVLAQANPTLTITPTDTPQPQPTPTPTPTIAPTPTPQPTPNSDSSKSDKSGPPTIVIFFGIFVVGTFLAIFISTRRIGRRR